MADVKISALPRASTPLAGTEVLPIVQSATTDQVSVANLTAGRAVSAASLTLTTTPLAVGSGGTGFSSITSGYVPYATGTNTLGATSGLQFDGSNLRIGATPSAWASGSNALQNVGGAFWSNAATLLDIPQNAYYASGGYTYSSTNPATFYRQLSGEHRWYNAPSGTAGNIISFAQAMTLTAGGQLLVGGTSALFPASGRVNVEVAGTSSSLYGMVVGGADKAYFLHDGTNLTVQNIANGYTSFATNNTERARIDSSGNLLVGTNSNTYIAKTVINGGFGATIASTYTLSNTAVKIAAGVGLLCIIRDTVNGSIAIVGYENTNTPSIIYQNSAGKYITTGTPTGTQILLANASGNAGIQASTAAGAGISVSVANIGCQN